MAGFPSLLDTPNHGSKIDVRHLRQEDVDPGAEIAWHVLVDTTQYVGNRQTAPFSTSILICPATLRLFLDVREDPSQLVARQRREEVVPIHELILDLPRAYFAR